MVIKHPNHLFIGLSNVDKHLHKSLYLTIPNSNKRIRVSAKFGFALISLLLLGIVRYNDLFIGLSNVDKHLHKSLYLTITNSNERIRVSAKFGFALISLLLLGIVRYNDL